jgi:hypothetical protein
MKSVGVLLGLLALVGCGARASQNAPDDITTAGGGGAGGSKASSGGAGGKGDGRGVAGSSGAASANVLLACHSPGGAQPPPQCTTQYTLGMDCDPATFYLCSTMGYTAEIVCGPPGSCIPPSDAGLTNLPNPCVGSCASYGLTCLYQVNTGLGGVSDYTCCFGDGGLAWLPGACPTLN